MKSLDKEKLLKSIKEYENEENSLKKQAKINLGLSVVNLGIYGLGFAFFPAYLVSATGAIGLLIHSRHISNKMKNINKKIFETTIDIKKYEDQMEFLQKLSKLIDGHYKEIFKDHKYIKEREICKHIKLNSPEQMDSKLMGQLKKQSQKLLESQEGNHYNILVLGRSGVGKSTLINVVLDLKGDKAAKESAVKPETGANNEPAPNLTETAIVEIKKNKFVPLEYSSEKSSLVLLDSRGIELSKNYNIDIATEDIKEFIEQRNGLDSDPDKFVHCVWYLVSGRRFEDDEGNYVKSLKSLYTNFGLPIIFVYTQAINEEDGDLIKERIEEFMGENINFIQIIARDMEVKTKNKKKKRNIIEAFGVFDEDGLIEKSFNLAKNAIKSSYFNYMKNLLKDIYVNIINLRAYLKANIFIFTKIESVIYKEKKSLEEVRNGFEKEFLDIINLFLIDKEIPENTKKNKILIKEFFNCFPNLNDPKLIELVDKLRETESDKLVGNYMDLNLKAEKIYGIKKQEGKEEIKSMLNKDIIEPIKQRIPYIALSYILLKYMGILGDNVYNRLSEDFEQSYKRIENKTEEELKIIINKVYDNIMKKSLVHNNY